MDPKFKRLLPQTDWSKPSIRVGDRLLFSHDLTGRVLRTVTPVRQEFSFTPSQYTSSFPTTSFLSYVSERVETV